MCIQIVSHQKRMTSTISKVILPILQAQSHIRLDIIISTLTPLVLAKRQVDSEDRL